MGFEKKGEIIRTLADWQRLGKPKSAKHWVDGRSAKELARAWLGQRPPAIPEEIDALLRAHPAFGSLVEWTAEPEARVPFDSFPGEPRNTDLLLVGRDRHGELVIAVEGKADETFGETVSEALGAALERLLERPNSNGIARIEGLAAALLSPRGRGPKIGNLRYQLLTASAGALAAAESRGIRRAVMFVHEFVTDATDDRRHLMNDMDLMLFLERLSGGVRLDFDGDGLVGPFSLPGEPLFDQVPELYIGKATRFLRAPGG